MEVPHPRVPSAKVVDALASYIFNYYLNLASFDNCLFSYTHADIYTVCFLYKTLHLSISLKMILGPNKIMNMENF